MKDTKPQLFSDMLWNGLLKDYSNLMTTIYDIAQYQTGGYVEKKCAMLSLINSLDISMAERRALTYWAEDLSIKPINSVTPLGTVYNIRQIVVCGG